MYQVPSLVFIQVVTILEFQVWHCKRSCMLCDFEHITTQSFDVKRIFNITKYATVCTAVVNVFQRIIEHMNWKRLAADNICLMYSVNNLIINTINITIVITIKDLLQIVCKNDC